MAIVAYLAFSLLVGQPIGLFAGDGIDTDDVLGTGGSIFFALVPPVAIGALALVGLTAAAGCGTSSAGRTYGAGAECGSRPHSSCSPSSGTSAAPAGTPGIRAGSP
ncbi:hypothetical protein [Streptomyces sp. NPDC058718]|uniref:hypothetical protein n=1 Tax=Streptomyces sp. NPDC058718 TaxID=3346610 RepID=UPI0036C02C53